MYCSMCGKEIQENSLFCNWCGTKVGEQNSISNKEFVIRGGVLEKYVGQSKTVIIPSNVDVIGDFSFKDCYGITKIIVPEGVTSIKHGAFENCEKLQSVDLPNTLVDLETGVFYGCKSLESIVIPGSLKRIEGVILFNKCISLKKIEFQEGITCISGEKAYSDADYASFFGPNSSIEEVVLPSTLKVIGHGAFKGCGKLKTVQIPDGTIMIGAEAFDGCKEIFLKIPESVKLIGNSAFYNCKKLKTVFLSNKICVGGSHRSYDVLNGEVPEVMEVGYKAFCGCEGLENVVLPTEITNTSIYPSTTSVISYIIDSCFEFTPMYNRKYKKLCIYCGGEFKGFLTKTCSVCGKNKNY